MKRSKLLFLTPAVALATVAPIVSCGEPAWTIDDIVDSIFNPCTDGTPKPEDCETFVDCLSTLSQKDLQKELIYSLFLLPTTTKYGFIDQGKTISYLWENDYLDMSANINKCSLNIDEGAVYANFFGYVNFIFNKDYVDHKTNDFIQITIVMDNVTVTPSSNLWFLEYPQIQPKECYGMMQIKKSGMIKLMYLDEIGAGLQSEKPKSWHNWIH